MFERVREALVSDTLRNLGISPSEHPDLITAEFVDSLYSECTYDVAMGIGLNRTCSLVTERWEVT